MALLGLLFRVCGGVALFGFRPPQRGAVKPLYLGWPVFQLDVRGEGGEGGGGLQETAVVKEAEDSTTLLGKGIQDETVLWSRENQEVRASRIILIEWFKVQL